MTDPLTIIHGDALSSLREIESESVQCCVTSPPYWGLRDYGLEPLVWGPLSRPWEPAQCRHEWSETIPGSARGGSGTPTDKNNRGESYGRDAERGAFCECGAWRGCLGLEPSPELYVAHLVEIFREVKRALRVDGTIWLNLGDSYCTTAPGTGMAGNSATSTLTRNSRLDKQDAERARNVRPLTPEGLKPKDLVGIPWRVALALQSDGWYLRSDIIWSKRSCMPESVRDRPTRSHEYIFLLSKSERYYYNAEAIAEPTQQIERPNFDGKRGLLPKGSYQGVDRCGNRKRDLTPRNDGQRWNENNGRGFKTKGKWSAEDPQSSGRRIVENVALARAEGGAHDSPFGDTRNKRSVWTITTQAYPDAHFATFPTEIPRICILAGSKPGDTVIDCFAGSGTTAKVAIELGRKAIAIEPKAEYVEMIKKRCQTTIGLPLAI